LVTAADRILLKYVTRTGVNIPINVAGVTSTSRGLVGDTVFAVLPNIKPIHTFVITIAFQSVVLIKLWLSPTYKSFLTALTLCGYTSFLFGWHVHEKAVLLILVPLSLLAAERHAYFRTFILCSVSGVFSLFPLLFTPAESFVEIGYSIIWIILVYVPLSRRVYEFPKSIPYVIIDTLEKIYLAGFPLLQLLLACLPLLARRDAASAAVCVPTDNFSCPDPGTKSASTNTFGMEFLPLMLTSVYCAVGMVWGFIRLIFVYLNETTYQGQLSTVG